MSSSTGDLAAAAAINAASTAASWVEALLVPGIQAAANILLMDHQKGQYDEIVDEQRQLIGIAVNNYTNCINSLLPDYSDIFPDIVEAAEYVPIDACCIQRATIECNIATTDRADVYARNVSRLHEQGDIIRAIALDPRFLVNADLVSFTIQDLLRGKSSVGDVMEVMTNNAEMSALQGRIGNSRRTTARDLGLSKMRSQTAGRREFQTNLASLNRDVSPLTRSGDIRDMMQTPAQRIGLALTQAQLIQNSLQNKNNQLAQKDPYLMAELQTNLSSCITKLNYEANKATMVNQFTPNWASILQPQVNAIAGAIGAAVSPAANTGNPANVNPNSEPYSAKVGVQNAQ